jgi:hypothetical protein
MSEIENVPFDFNIEINYDDNKKYRETIRKIFKMKKQYYIENNNIIFINGKVINCDDIDEEELDEIDYDNSVFNNCFNYILKITENIDIMIELYNWSSQKYILPDNQSGIANLFSYYYLPNFYKLLCTLHNSGLNIDSSDYQNLITPEMIESVKNAKEYAEYESFYD